MSSKLNSTWPPGSVLSAGILLGAGLGGFVDGILFHQLLQWHNMLSSVRPPTNLISMKVNMLWDGIFHALVWLLTLIGLFRLWGAARRGLLGEETMSSWIGTLLIGWGLFNAVEGMIDHFILGIHHVHPGQDELAWDVGFVALGLFSLGIGMAMVRTPRMLQHR